MCQEREEKLSEEKKSAHAAWHVKSEQTVVSAQQEEPCALFLLC